MPAIPGEARIDRAANGLRIECTDVEKRYGANAAVSSINLDVPEGQCLALLGPNGAGKTTLFKLMLGLVCPTEGKILIGGHTPGHHAVQNLIGFLPESVAFDRASTGRETLVYLARLKGAPVCTCTVLLDDVGLTEAADHRIGTYSKGMRQRLGLAQALLGAPRLLLLDEPTSGLDPDLRRHFYGLIARLRQAGVTIVISSHALSEIETVADSFVFIRQGRTLAHGPLAALKMEADLPVRMRVSVADGDAARIAARFNGRATITHVNGRTIEIECDERRKISTVCEIADMHPSIGDLEIKPPTLEVLYEHFMRRETDL